MQIDRTLRAKLSALFLEQTTRTSKYLAMARVDPAAKRKILVALREADPNMTYGEVENQLFLEMNEFRTAHILLESCKVIAINSDQANIFLDMSRGSFTDDDYRLPFETTMLQFDKPLHVKCNGKDDTLIAVIATQAIMDQEFLDRAHAAMVMRRGTEEARKMLRYFDVEKQIGKRNFMIIPVFGDSNQRVLTWMEGHEDFTEQILDKVHRPVYEEWRRIRHLVRACFAYINAENVYLDRVEGASTATNRKRAQKKKPPIEDFYLTKIKGIAYDNQHRPVADSQPTGRHVSFRFDVRGHFRRYKSGRVVWVSAHQRGLQHERYIPKIYTVERREPA